MNLRREFDTIVSWGFGEKPLHACLYQQSSYGPCSSCDGQFAKGSPVHRRPRPMTLNLCWSRVLVNGQGRSGNRDNMEARSGPIKNALHSDGSARAMLVCRPTGANHIRWREQLNFGAPLGLTSQPAGGAGEDELLAHRRSADHNLPLQQDLDRDESRTRN